MKSLVVIAIVGCSGAEPPPPGADAATLFAKYCTTCHGDTGRPTAAMAARLGVKDLTAPELRARITPALVEKQIRKGSDNKLMPAFVGLLDDAQMRAVADYVASPTFAAPR